MNIIYNLFIYFVLINYAPKNVNNISQNLYIKIDNIIRNFEIRKDTVITYFIDGIASEGAEAKVFYKKDSIVKIELGYAGERGKGSICYLFFKNKIEVIEKKYHYRTNMNNLKSSSDIIFDKENKYSIDYNGKLLKGKSDDYFFFYQKIRENIPFVLN